MSISAEQKVKISVSVPVCMAESDLQDCAIFHILPNKVGAVASLRIAAASDFFASGPLSKQSD